MAKAKKGRDNKEVIKQITDEYRHKEDFRWNTITKGMIEKIKKSKSWSIFQKYEKHYFKLYIIDITADAKPKENNMNAHDRVTLDNKYFRLHLEGSISSNNMYFKGPREADIYVAKDGDAAIGKKEVIIADRKTNQLMTKVSSGYELKKDEISTKRPIDIAKVCCFFAFFFFSYAVVSSGICSQHVRLLRETYASDIYIYKRFSNVWWL